MKKNPQFIVVIGASAGGNEAIGELAARLDSDIDAAYFVVMHLSGTAIGELLQQRLQKLTPLPCLLAKDGDEIKKGHIYIAPPDYHLILKDNHTRVVKGPMENRWRPSINVLFRSAAVSYNSHVIGIILTGLLDDGTSGMIAIKRCGGMTIVQDPNEAEFPEMPLSVLNNMQVGHSLPLFEIGPLIKDIVQDTNPKPVDVPEEIKLESAISEKCITDLETISRLGKHTIYACPDCGGGLWEIEEREGKKSFRCHVGHSYSLKDLLLRQNASIETTLWVALRMMEERSNLLKRIAEDEKQKGLKSLADSHFKKQQELAEHIKQLKSVLFVNREEQNPTLKAS